MLKQPGFYYLLALALVLVALGYVGGHFNAYRLMTASNASVECRLNDGTRVPVEKFVLAHGAFASSTGVCKVKQ